MWQVLEHFTWNSALLILLNCRRCCCIMYNNEAILPVVVIFTVLIAPVSGNSSARPTPYPPRTDHALPHNVTTPQCLSNQSRKLYSIYVLNQRYKFNHVSSFSVMTCSVHHKCCQSQSNILVEQLQQIKDKFQAVDSVIRKDYENMRGTYLVRDTSELFNHIWVNLPCM